MAIAMAARASMLAADAVGTREVDRLIEGAQDAEPGALLRLLGVRGEAQARLFSAACAARDAVFGATAVVRGVVEVTSACVKSCAYCPMRVEAAMPRYHRRGEALVASARAIREAGLGVVFFQGGEAAATTRTVGEAIPEVRDLFGGEVEILLCLGDKPREAYAELRAKGADSYILKHETSDPVLHERMRGSPLAARLHSLHDLVELGYRTGIGTIVGLPGQSLDSLVEDIRLPRAVGAAMTSASPFIPAAGTPLQHAPPGDTELTLNVIALMRLANPEALIPTVSALEQRGAGGQARGFAAGANVITVNFTPPEDQDRYPIYGRERFIVGLTHAFDTLAAAGLKPRLGADAFAFAR
jgi:biotin synthase